MPSKRATPARRGTGGPGRTPAPRRRSNAALWMLPALAVALALVAVGTIVSRRQSAAAPAVWRSADGQPIPEDVLRNLTTIPAKTWDAVAAQDAYRPFLVGVPHASAMPPVVLYVGAEYCPYCAAMRWPLAAALARFGTFTGLALSASSATDAFPSTPTLTFLRSRYTSPRLTLETVELQGNVQDATGGYPALQRPTAAQAAVFRHFDPPGQIPFLLIGGQYLWTGSPFSPALLHGATWQAVASSLPTGATPAAQAILATGNEISAAICAVDAAAPAAVCRSAGVRAAAETLPAAGTH